MIHKHLILYKRECIVDEKDSRLAQSMDEHERSMARNQPPPPFWLSMYDNQWTNYLKISPIVMRIEQIFVEWHYEGKGVKILLL